MDATTRRAALWATLFAVPLTLVVAILAVSRLSSDRPTGPAGATGTTPTGTPHPASTTPVALPAPALAERPATVCRALLSRLPATVADLSQRPVSAGPEQNAAYGDPALTVACGVSPVPVAPTDDLWVVNKVCWHVVAQRPGGTELTTVDREVPVRVTVPGAYQPPLQWVAPLADPVLTSVRSIDDVPSGCRS